MKKLICRMVLLTILLTMASPVASAKPLSGNIKCGAPYHICKLYQTEMTAYAFGNRDGMAGEIKQGHFASHPDHCGDAAGGWKPGTRFKMSSPTKIEVFNEINAKKERTIFKKKDVGDFACNELPNWVDIYHGRYRGDEMLPPNGSQDCSCPGVPSPGFCKAGDNDVENCDDAFEFGRKRARYNTQFRRCHTPQGVPIPCQRH
jgi:hypothetical protein